MLFVFFLYPLLFLFDTRHILILLISTILASLNVVCKWVMLLKSILCKPSMSLITETKDQWQKSLNSFIRIYSAFGGGCFITAIMASQSKKRVLMSQFNWQILIHSDTHYIRCFSRADYECSSQALMGYMKRALT